MKFVPVLLALAIAAAACSPREPEPEPAATVTELSCCPAETLLAEFEGIAFRCTLMTRLVSEDGRLSACTYHMTTVEGGAAIVFCDRAKVLGSLAYARAIAWEPHGARLLVRDAAPDDDPRLFVLDVGAGELGVRPEERLRRIVGERADEFRGWEGDTLLLLNRFGPGNVRRVAIPPR